MCEWVCGVRAPKADGLGANGLQSNMADVTMQRLMCGVCVPWDKSQPKADGLGAKGLHSNMADVTMQQHFGQRLGRVACASVQLY